jgi:hypothetical protein
VLIFVELTAKWFSEANPVNAKESSLTTNISVAQGELVFTAKLPGTEGNSISVTYVDPAGNNKALSVVTTGSDIVINLATGAGGAITTTANNIIAALASHSLVTVAKKAGNDGSGVVTAMAKATLTGGVNGTIAPIPYTYVSDGTYYYTNIAPNGVRDKNWRRFQLASY